MGDSAGTVLFLAGLPDDRRIVVDDLTPSGQVRFFHAAGLANFDALLPLAGLTKERVFLPLAGQVRLRLPRQAVVFSLLTNPDTSAVALGLAATALAALDRPVLNAPAAVLAGTRDALARRLADIPGLAVPPTVRVSPSSAAALLEEIESSGIGYPCLVRPAGAHQAQGTLRLGSAADAARLDALALDGRPVYVTAFVDTRGSAGLFTKYRLAFVGETVLPRHRFVSDHWQVNTEAGYFERHPEHHAAEREWLAGFSAWLTPAHRATLAELRRRVGLDVFGLDCALDAGGRLVFFEANASMRLLEAPGDFPAAFKYRVPAVVAIAEAIDELVRARLGGL